MGLSKDLFLFVLWIFLIQFVTASQDRARRIVCTVQGRTLNDSEPNSLDFGLLKNASCSDILYVLPKINLASLKDELFLLNPAEFSAVQDYVAEKPNISVYISVPEKHWIRNLDKTSASVHRAVKLIRTLKSLKVKGIDLIFESSVKFSDFIAPLQSLKIFLSRNELSISATIPFTWAEQKVGNMNDLFDAFHVLPISLIPDRVTNIEQVLTKQVLNKAALFHKAGFPYEKLVFAIPSMLVTSSESATRTPAQILEHFCNRNQLPEWTFDGARDGSVAWTLPGQKWSIHTLDKDVLNSLVTQLHLLDVGGIMLVDLTSSAPKSAACSSSKMLLAEAVSNTSYQTFNIRKKRADPTARFLIVEEDPESPVEGQNPGDARSFMDDNIYLRDRVDSIIVEKRGEAYDYFQRYPVNSYHHNRERPYKHIKMDTFHEGALYDDNGRVIVPEDFMTDLMEHVARRHHPRDDLSIMLFSQAASLPYSIPIILTWKPLMPYECPKPVCCKQCKHKTTRKPHRSSTTHKSTRSTRPTTVSTRSTTKTTRTTRPTTRTTRTTTRPTTRTTRRTTTPTTRRTTTRTTTRPTIRMTTRSTTRTTRPTIGRVTSTAPTTRRTTTRLPQTTCYFVNVDCADTTDEPYATDGVETFSPWEAITPTTTRPTTTRTTTRTTRATTRTTRPTIGRMTTRPTVRMTTRPTVRMTTRPTIGRMTTRPTVGRMTTRPTVGRMTTRPTVGRMTTRPTVRMTTRPTIGRMTTQSTRRVTTSSTTVTTDSDMATDTGSPMTETDVFTDDPITDTLITDDPVTDGGTDEVSTLEETTRPTIGRVTSGRYSSTKKRTPPTPCDPDYDEDCPPPDDNECSTTSEYDDKESTTPEYDDDDDECPQGHHHHNHHHHHHGYGGHWEGCKHGGCRSCKTCKRCNRNRG